VPRAAIPELFVAGMAKMQWIQDPSQSNLDNMNNVRREVSRHFRNKNNAYLKAKIEEQQY
jgi:hypothetical protein